jgi:glucose-6-phosphate 1-dehydrogenase
MVIFGAAGDLTQRLLVPALYELVRAGRLPAQFRLVGVATRDKSTEQWAADLRAAMDRKLGSRLDDTAWRWLAERMTFVSGDLNDAALYGRLARVLADLETKAGTHGNALFYLAVPDRLFASAIEHLGSAGLLAEDGGRFRRVVIEKPFGHDLASARALDRDILRFIAESQVYRIDHFLGKETVQNVMALRFANGLFEPIWNRGHIDHVQITAAETLGVERRAKFYEGTGALRDMVPNHLFQLLAFTAMEPPTSFEAAAVRAKKSEVIGAIRPMSREDALRDVVRGQYAAGSIGGTPVPGYREEPDVAPQSTTETFVAMKVLVDTWRWAGVPFYLRTGKRLRARQTEIAIRFHQAPYSIFRGTDVERMHGNWMIVRIAPEEAITLEFAAKRPGPAVRLETVGMEFCYERHFKTAPQTGYETLLYDCMIGDATLFQRADNIEAGWQAVQPILDAWASESNGSLASYAAGSAGPAAADALLAREGRSWRPLGVPPASA